MRIVQFLLRFAAALGLLYIAVPFADAFESIEVTAPGLVLTVIVLVALHLFGTGTAKLIAPRRSIAVAGGDYVLGSARLGRSPAMMLHKDLEKRARHEAAHAVVAHALGHLVLSASVAPDRGSGGRVVWRHSDAAFAQASIDHIAVTFAGPLAEQTGDVVQAAENGADDYSALLRTAIAASITDPENRTPGEILDAGTKTARRLVLRHSRAIEALTYELLATEEKRDLGEDEIRGLMQLHHVRPHQGPDPHAQ